MKIKMIMVSALLATIMTSTTSISAYAQGTQIIPISESEVCSIREDIPSKIAEKDSTYNTYYKKVPKTRNFILKTSKKEKVKWKTWGEREEGIKNNRYYCKPIGYSEHRQGSKVLNTYHYTRCYFGRVAKCGDSQRSWGYGTVKAIGTECTLDEADGTLVVKYGTTD